MSDNIGSDIETFNQCLKEVASIYRTAVSRAGISENEFWVWYALLIMGGEYSQQDICEVWSLPKQTANTIINNMVKKGHITLEAIPGTRNRKRIRVLEDGRKYGEQIVMPIYNAERRSICEVPEEDRKLSLEVIERYMHILKKELRES